MKKILFAFSFVLLSISAFSINVTFSVDMRYQSVSVNGVHVSGDFQMSAGYPGNWEPGTTTLTNVPGTSIYSITVNIPANTKYEYRFINGDQEYESEFIPEKSRVGFNFNDNRWVYIDSVSANTVELPSVIFGGNAPYQKKLIRLSVDMQKQTIANTFDISVNSSKMYSFYDHVYEAVLFVDSNETLTYSFSNATQIETVPEACNTNGFRTFMVSEDTVASMVCFSSCTDCASTGVNSIYESKFGINIFPNPSSDIANVSFSNSTDRNIYLFDMNGRKLNQYLNSTEKVVRINTEVLNAGIYVLRVEQDGNVENLKLIVR